MKTIVPKRTAERVATMIPVKKTAKRPNLGIFGLMAYKLRRKKTTCLPRVGRGRMWKRFRSKICPELKREQMQISLMILLVLYENVTLS